MLSTLGFWLAFAATLVAMAVALVSGLRRRRRLHVCSGPATVALLLLTVLLTAELKAAFTFPATVMRIHLPLAITAGLLAVAVALTGVLLLLLPRPRLRRLHRYTVFAFVATAVAATATGVWAFAVATPR